MNAPAEPRRTGPAEPPAQEAFVRRVVTVLALTAVAGGAITLLVLGLDILLAAFAGILLAIVLRACMDLLTRHVPLSDGWAYTAVLLILLTAMGAGGWLLAPQVARQANELGERLPQIGREITDYLQQYEWGRRLLSTTENAVEERRVRDREQPPGQGQEPDRAEGQAEDSGDNGGLPEAATQGLVGLLDAVSTWATYMLTALFVGLFAAANPALYRDGFIHLFPIRHRARLGEVLDRIGFTLRWWLIGQLFSMTLIGVSTMIVLWIFGVPLAIILGLIVGLLGFVPYLGPIVGLVPVALIAATQDVSTLAYVVAAYTGIQLLEGYVANPLIHQGTVHLPPATTVGVQMLMGAVVGVIGIVLATPLAAVLLVLTRFYRIDILGDRAAEKDD
jgi:predicted PurR-regulated permease PerM